MAAVELALLPWLRDLDPTQAGLCMVQTGVATAGIARSAYPGLRPVALVAFVFTFSWLGVAPLYQLSHHVAAWGDDTVLASSDATAALALNALAVVCMYLGFLWSSPGPRWRHRRPIRGVNAPRWVCAVYVGSCLLLAPTAISAAGGVGALFSSRDARNAAFAAQGIVLESVGGLHVALVGILPGALATAGTYLVLLRVLDQRRSGGWCRVLVGDAAILVLGLVLVALFANPFVNTRGLSAAALGSLVLAVMRPRSGKAGIWMAVVLLLSTLVAYPAANVFRGDDIQRQGGLAALASSDFDGFQQVINSVSYVGDLGHSWGAYALSGTFYFIPRSLWPGKKMPASLDVAAHRGYSFTNLSLPLHAELYVDFGVVGMCVAIFLLASFGRRCDEDWMLGRPSRLAQSVPYVSLAVLSVIRGPIGANAPVYLTNMGLIALGLLIAKRSHAVAEPTPEGALPGSPAPSHIHLTYVSSCSDGAIPV